MNCITIRCSLKVESTCNSWPLSIDIIVTEPCYKHPICHDNDTVDYYWTLKDPYLIKAEITCLEMLEVHCCNMKSRYHRVYWNYYVTFELFCVPNPGGSLENTLGGACELHSEFSFKNMFLQIYQCPHRLTTKHFIIIIVIIISSSSSSSSTIIIIIVSISGLTKLQLIAFVPSLVWCGLLSYPNISLDSYKSYPRCQGGFTGNGSPRVGYGWNELIRKCDKSQGVIRVHNSWGALRGYHQLNGRSIAFYCRPLASNKTHLTSIYLPATTVTE